MVRFVFLKESAPRGRVALPRKKADLSEKGLCPVCALRAIIKEARSAPDWIDSGVHPSLRPPGDYKKRREARLTGLTPIVHPSLRPPGD